MATYARKTRRSTVEWAGGTIATPVTAVAYKVHNLSVVEQSIAVENGNTMGVYGLEPPRPGGRSIAVSFGSELRGSDTNDVPPPEMALLRACGFSETASGTTPAIVYSYTLDDPHLVTDSTAGDLDPINLVCSHDRLERTAENCVGNCVFNFTAGQLPTMNFNFIGNCVTATAGGADAAMGTFTSGAAPVPVVNESLGLNFNEAGEITSLICPSLTFDCGNIIAVRPDMSGEFGFAGPRLSGHNPSFRMLVEVPPITDIDLEAAYLSRHEVDFQFEHNSGGGIRHHVIVTFSGIITEFPRLVDQNGIWYYDLVGRQNMESASTKFTLAWQAA